MQTFRASFTRLPRAMQQYEYHLTVLWLVLQLLPYALTQPAKVQQCSPLSDTTRQLCQHFGASSCDFYTHCIDSLSNCGPQGFAQSYAQHRCENMRQLNASRNSPLVQWAASQDQCLQGRLYNMISSGPKRLSCLQLESTAFEQLDACYNSSKQQLCAALKATDSKAFLRDIPSLLQAIGGSEYYVGLAVATEALWKYFGVDWNWRCVGLNPQLSRPGSPSDSDYFHFVEWYPNATGTVAPVIPGGLGTLPYSPTATFFYLAFSLQYSNTTCGDGLLQAGELCDLAAYNNALSPISSSSHPVLANMTGCSTQCTNAPEFECYAKPLQPSICARVTCGDGLKASTEACDDGNTMDGDGCSSSCTIDLGYQCRIAGLLSLCKQVSLPPSNITTASPTPSRPGTLHPFAATLVADSPQPSPCRSVSTLSILHILLLSLIVMSWAR
eukprot:Em0011g31a